MDAGMSYSDWIAKKMQLPPDLGIRNPSPMADHLFPHQRSVCEWALRKGRAAIFADTGLGKTAMQLEWARQVADHSDGRVIILAPLAVADQTVREGQRFGVDCKYAREDTGARIVVTNYEMLHSFSPEAFNGVVLDESSILKAYDGKTRAAIIDAFKSTPYRLACTATPAPNDHMELGNHSEFLGVKTRAEMLAEYFVHDGGSTSNWRLKGHARDVFWRWVCSWAVMVKKPSDLGYDDDGYDLPPLNMHEHVVGVSYSDAHSEGFLFAPPALSLNEQRATRRMTMDKRVSVASELAASDGPVLIWCELNAEGDAITAAIPDAVQVAGSDNRETKRSRLLGFSDGSIRVLVTKPSVAGFGMNWQHCSKVVFAGASHSFEQTYQAIRRCWRFGQKNPVNVHIIRAETEDAILRNIKRKQEDADRMAEGMLRHMKSAMADYASVSRREWNPYEPGEKMIVPEWIGAEEGS